MYVYASMPFWKYNSYNSILGAGTFNFNNWNFWNIFHLSQILSLYNPGLTWSLHLSCLKYNAQNHERHNSIASEKKMYVEPVNTCLKMDTCECSSADNNKRLMTEIAPGQILHGFL